MTEFPSLASVIATHRWTRTKPFVVECTGCDWSADLKTTVKSSVELVAEHVERVWLETRTITTLEQLDALPEQTVIRNVMFGVVFECVVENDGTYLWQGIHGEPRTSVSLPALVLHHPSWPELKPSTTAQLALGEQS